MKYLRYVITLLFLYSSYLFAQEHWINGFSERIHGENLEYHSCHPDANLALLIRCLNNNDFIEWKTDTIPNNYNSNNVTFAWIAGYSVATSTAPHKFFLYLNDKLLFEFATSPSDNKKDWNIIAADGSVLHFKFIKIDAVDDFFGYMVLTTPIKNLVGKNFAKLKIKGDGTNSKDWYMTMQYPLVAKTRITPEKIITKGTDGKLYQRAKISIDHFDSPKSININSENNDIDSKLTLGMNDFYLNFPASNSTTKKKINISIDGKSKTYNTIIHPARKITFYLIPHAHVDIGYTELQTEVEKKHWDNYDKAISYSEESSNFDSNDVFKWNVEVLWAVKSYLEKFPEKKEKFFDAVRKGWMGLDATYVNVLTGLCRPEELYELVEYSNKLEKEIGVKIQSAMITDVPGYTWGIVQAFADNGIKYFSVGPNPGDRIGNTLKAWGDKPFYWKSPSGKEKILIWLAGKSYAWFHQWRLTRDDISPIAKYLDELDEENYPYDMVHLRYNIGGDNGFPDSTLSEFVKNWNESHVTPKFKISTNMEMFKDFEKKYSKVIPTYSGDFTPYWEDGAWSTAKETILNRNTAELLTQLETYYTQFDKDNYPQKDFDEAWRYVLLYSEHTWGAWNSISDPELKFVTDQWEIKKSYALKADSIAQKLLQNLNTKNDNDHFYVYNSSSWQRSDVIQVPSNVSSNYSSVVDEYGNSIPTQKLSNGNLVFTAKDIPPFGIKEFKLTEGKNDFKNESPIVDQTFSNNYYELKVDSNNSSIIYLGKPNSNFNYVDKSKKLGLNEFIHTGQNAVNPTYAKNSKIINFENGPVLKSLTLQSDAQGCNNLLQKIVLFNDLDKIEFVNTIDKKKDYSKESIRFTFNYNIKDPVSRINLAWSVIEPEKDQLNGANKNYFTAERWYDVSNKNIGITLATVDAPLTEFGGMNAEAWMASPDKEWFNKTASSSETYSWAMNNSWHTNYKASQEGKVIFKYFLNAHDKFDYLSAYKFGIESSQPLEVIYSKNLSKNYKPILTLDTNSSIVVTRLKPAQDKKNVIIRLFNPTNQKSISTLSLNRNEYQKIYLSNGDEEEIKEIGNEIELSPFEVITLKVKEK